MAFVSSRKSVFIIGIGGFLGSTIAMKLRERFLVSGIYFHNPIWIPDVQTYSVQLNTLELLDPIAAIQSPQIIINATGIQDLQEIKKNEKLAESINVMLPVSIASLASRLKAKFIQLSTAAIYEGNEKLNKETSLNFTSTDPVGKLKSTAETYIRSQSLESTILRIGKVAGVSTISRPSFFDQLRMSLIAKKNINLSELKKESYLSAQSLGEAVEKVCSSEFPERHRILNLGSVPMSEMEFAKNWCSLTGAESKLLKPLLHDEEKNIVIDNSLFCQSFPDWKPETKKKMFENIITSLAPHVSPKRWQKILQSQ